MYHPVKYVYIYIHMEIWLRMEDLTVFFLGRHNGDISLGMEKLMELRNLWL